MMALKLQWIQSSIWKLKKFKLEPPQWQQLTWVRLNFSLTSNKPTHYLLNYGDFNKSSGFLKPIQFEKEFRHSPSFLLPFHKKILVWSYQQAHLPSHLIIAAYFYMIWDPQYSHHSPRSYYIAGLPVRWYLYIPLYVVRIEVEFSTSSDGLRPGYPNVIVLLLVF